MSNDSFDNYDDQNRPRGMSTGKKILLALAILFGVSMIACCGGGYWMFRNAIKMTQVPAEIQEIQNSIANISIPDEYQPQMGMRMQMFVTMKMAVFGRTQGGSAGQIVLMEMQLPGQLTEQQMKEAMEQQMDQRMDQDSDMTIESRETRTFTIDGQERNFEFVVGKNKDGQTVHRVMGLFPGRSGMAYLLIMEDEENWNEEAVEAMIRSISTNGAAPAEPDAPETEEPAPETQEQPVEQSVGLPPAGDRAGLLARFALWSPSSGV